MSQTANSPAGGGGGARVNWQTQLQEYCRKSKIQAPVYNIFSERRGGRTAWSSSVAVSGQTLVARYWYDGENVNNAKEDAAEVALSWLTPGSSSAYTGQSPSYQQPRFN
ncbi:hypothetical protein P168DRAFT_341109 [Aspergillus campestris IBT 28561]|uniref:DRBM domain-containing protein n=1 Tax=Aspergillus campestris (strain IBT 28561) TaxID=1392248 RepID=A0A2I1D6U7_ASPC2|nr:uncharacterized protein P168DRAFT_341109 [Aspergillus campestris IBT 28561]PKY05606.1 hypothetical protein P168DRAFT_341109 [Aspergillus campestris IBT 28561]